MKHNVVSLMVSADWHLGATDPNRFRLELLRTVEHKLKKEKSLDLFVVAGDIFDMKEYFSSETVKVLCTIMKELLAMTSEYNTQFRFLEGTRTHDAMQLETLEIIFNDLMENDRIKFFHEVDEEELLGLKILYLPEEYITHSEAYYAPYFEKHYDFIFGHGPTDMMWYMRKQDTSNKYSAATVFKVDELCQVANYVYFGHFHYRIASGPDNRFKSIGPVSRWEFDKDEDCGLYYTIYDSNTGLAVEEFVVNEYAPILPTVALSVKQDYELNVLNKKIIDKIDKVRDSADKTRLIITIDSRLENFIMMRDFVLASFGNIPGVTLLLKIIGVEEIVVAEDETNGLKPKSVAELVEENPYLYDKSMRDEERIAAFIKKKKGINISLENILEVILPKDNRLKNREE